MGKSKNRRKKPLKDGRKRSRSRSIQAVPSRDLALLSSVADQIADLPLGECSVSEGWQEEGGLIQVCITRLLPNDKLLVVIFLVDLGCLGIKSVIAKKLTAVELQQMLSLTPTPYERCDPALAVKVVTTGHDYAAELDLKPAPEYQLASLIFGDIDPDSCAEEIKTGKDGKPFFVAGPDDDVHVILNHLTDRLGPEGFDYMVAADLLASPKAHSSSEGLAPGAPRRVPWRLNSRLG
jgi:hypothetical protein